ncbi:hypothetical protein pb186bvf_012755 [Paramecium bursaria]
MYLFLNKRRIITNSVQFLKLSNYLSLCSRFVRNKTLGDFTYCCQKNRCQNYISFMYYDKCQNILS